MLNKPYRCIGRGFCGTVWALEDDQQLAIKREDGGPGRSLTNDYDMHLRVMAAFQRCSTPLHVPQCHKLIQHTNIWWEQHLCRFPAGYSACRALLSERIPRVPRSISDKIVDLFCASNSALCDFVKRNPDDDACLIRPYLGRRRRYHQGGATTSRFQRFSLRNVPLHVDQMEKLSLDTASYAEAMAEALAHMHWGAQIDANDVEFVLAPLPAREDESSASSSTPFRCEYLGTHCMWILDFDCCRTMSMDEAGVEQACVAFYRNDPFYPRPGSGEVADQNLWELFKLRFLETSRKILNENLSYLAERLVARIEEEGKSRTTGKQELVFEQPLLATA